MAQNVPNPFNSNTTIKYSIPANNTAMIAVFDLNGKMLLQFLNLKGAAQVTINGNTLQAGMYLYSLLFLNCFCKNWDKSNIINTFKGSHFLKFLFIRKGFLKIFYQFW